MAKNQPSKIKEKLSFQIQAQFLFGVKQANIVSPLTITSFIKSVLRMLVKLIGFRPTFKMKVKINRILLSILFQYNHRK